MLFPPPQSPHTTRSPLLLAFFALAVSVLPVSGADTVEPAFLVREVNSGSGLGTSARTSASTRLTAAPVGAESGVNYRVVLNKKIRNEATILLNLSETIELLAEATRVESGPNGGFVWVGRVAGESLSEVVLVSHGNTAAGHVTRPMEDGSILYTLRPEANDLTILSEPVLGELPEGCETVPVPGSGAALQSRSVRSRRAALAVESFPVATAENPAILDVLFVYSPATSTRYGGVSGVQALIQEAVASANTGYINSGVHARVRVAHSQQVAFTETGSLSDALSRLAGTADGSMDEVHALRDQYGADLVVLLEEDTGSCGIGYQMSAVGTAFAPWAFSVVSSACVANFSVAHEIGHNMGCLHNREDTTLTGAFPYSYGHRLCTTDGSGFRTVMSYNCTATSVPRVNYFSNPNITFNGLPTGVPSTDALPCDNTQSLNRTAHTVAAFRGAVATLPSAPTGLGAAAVSGTRVDLTWTDNAANETGYQVLRSTAGGAFASVAELAPNAASYSDTTVSGGVTYAYQVVAFGWAGSSAPSSTATVTTPIAPAAPTGLSASAAGSTRVNLTWVDATTTETGFRLERSTNGVAFTTLASVAANVTTYADTTVAASRTYFYRVIATSAGGDSPASNVASVTTPSAVPATPTGLTATAISSTQINLAWVDASSNESGFRIERSTDGTTYALLASVGANVTTYSNTGLTAGRKYYYRVIATSTAGNSPASTVASATTLAAPPAAPTTLKASAASTTQINLTWADKSTNETGFEVQRSADGGVTYLTVATTAANIKSYASTGLTTKKTYHFRVRAVGSGTASAWSNVASATTR